MKKNKKKIKLKKKSKIIIISLIIIVVLGLALLYYAFSNNLFNKTPKEIINKILPKQVEKEIKIINLDNKTRPYAVVIDNVKNARPQYGLSESYLIYEMIVEGGLTRMLALFKDSNVEQVGPVRSARHYFLDYALENDAIFVHFGWSPQAESDISKLKIQNLNGLSNPSSMFWRDSKKHSSPHNVFTSTANMLKASGNLKQRTDSNEFKLLNYVADEFDLSEKFSNEELLVPANEIKINYSNSVNSSFIYDNTEKIYLKSINGTSHIDATTNKQLSFKNVIVVTGITNYTIDNDKNRQDIKNLGSGEGYYITNGKALKITWNKKTREDKTIYKDYEGKEIEINDGNTYISIQPTNQKLTIN